MANTCINYLELTEGNKKKFSKMLIDLMPESDKEGQLPEIVTKRERFLFDIDGDNGLFSFWTKWAPPIDEMEEMGKKLKTSFTLSYEELGCGIFGKYFYNHKEDEGFDVCLDDSEIDQVVEDEESGVYSLRGEIYESQGEALEVLLNEKIAKL